MEVCTSTGDMSCRRERCCCCCGGGSAAAPAAVGSSAAGGAPSGARPLVEGGPQAPRLSPSSGDDSATSHSDAFTAPAGSKMPRPPAAAESSKEEGGAVAAAAPPALFAGNCFPDPAQFSWEGGADRRFSESRMAPKSASAVCASDDD